LLDSETLQKTNFRQISEQTAADRSGSEWRHR